VYDFEVVPKEIKALSGINDLRFIRMQSKPELTFQYLFCSL